MTEEMSFQVSLEHCQGFSIPDGGGKFIPPARNSEWKRSVLIIYVIPNLYGFLSYVEQQQTRWFEECW